MFNISALQRVVFLCDADLLSAQNLRLGSPWQKSSTMLLLHKPIHQSLLSLSRTYLKRTVQQDSWQYENIKVNKPCFLKHLTNRNFFNLTVFWYQITI